MDKKNSRFGTRIRKRIKMMTGLWKSDREFSYKYAVLRVIDTVCGRIGIKGISNWAFKKKEVFRLNYLRNLLSSVIAEYKDKDFIGTKEDKAPIWTCWWTGAETAPIIVKKCLQSIEKNAGDHPVVLITEENYSKYIDIPEYILQKQAENKIGLAHFADYLRVSLLNRYGGVWLDATIFCPYPIPDLFFSNPFFTCRSPYTKSRYLSHFEWVTFCLGGWKNNCVYGFLQKAFELYWDKCDYAIDYLLFDDLIYLAKENIPSINRMISDVPLNTPRRDNLQAAMNAALPAEEFWNIVQPDTEIYKLSWRESYDKKTKDGKMSVYGYFLNLNSEKRV